MRHFLAVCVLPRALILDEKLLDFLLNGCDLRFDLRSLVLCDGGGYDGAGDAAGSAKGLLRPETIMTNKVYLFLKDVLQVLSA